MPYFLLSERTHPLDFHEIFGFLRLWYDNDSRIPDQKLCDIICLSLELGLGIGTDMNIKKIEIMA